MAALKDRGIRRVQEKLNASVTSGKYYEAHQMYKTLYFRLLSQNKFDELLEMLEKGATLLLEHKQNESGSDLAILFVDVLTKAKVSITIEWITKVTKLFSLMNPTMPERDSYVINATRWSMGETQRTNPIFHGQIAKIYRDQENYRSARQHYFRSSDGEALATMLVDLQTKKGLRSEVDLYLAQAILQMLCLKKVQLAADTFKYYTRNHPAIKKEDLPYPKPLINFLFMLFKALDQKKADMFKELLTIYEPAISRDITFSNYLDKIGHMYLGIPLKPRQRPNGLFGNIFQSFMGSFEGDDDSEDEFNAGKSEMKQEDLD